MVEQGSMVMVNDPGGYETCRGCLPDSEVAGAAIWGIMFTAGIMFTGGGLLAGRVRFRRQGKRRFLATASNRSSAPLFLYKSRCISTSPVTILRLCSRTAAYRFSSYPS